MGDLLHPVRLLWSNGHGSARYYGLSWVLQARPEIDGLQDMTELDYIPGELALMRRRCDRLEDMTPAESAAVLRWLQAQAAAHERSTP